MAVKFKLLPKQAGVDKTSVSPVKEGIYFDNLEWEMDDEKTIISIDATKLGVTITAKNIVIKKKDAIQQRLHGCIKIAQDEAQIRLERKLKNQKN